MRYLENRLRIILFFGKPDDTQHFVNKLFLRTLERETISPLIDQEIKHLPRAGNVCDEDLLAAVIRVSTYEHERSTLSLQASKKIAKVDEASSKENFKAKQDYSVLKLVTAVQSLSYQLTS